VRGIRDTSRNGRYHNQKFAALAAEMGLSAEKVGNIGWSSCTMRAETIAAHASTIADLDVALRAYRHPEGVSQTTTSNNGMVLICGCPLRLRASNAVVDTLGTRLICPICDIPFAPEETP